MRLTPAILASCYTLLRETEPFCRWRLPEAPTIKFVVSQHRQKFAECVTDWDRRRFRETRHFQISVSEVTVHTLDRLLRQMAHEMIHVRQGVTSASGTEHKRVPHHGADFTAMEQQVCKAHRWDHPL